ncbi:hypothetical protein [Falsiroseomonas ponticola]|uniref:hypothetical protein n=1 Tax=Falsiroseomonas ponticola TaxID=2786951 RepID=UPI001934351A|nr:hypothetical protein [Roseomonas ponticola]
MMLGAALAFAAPVLLPMPAYAQATPEENPLVQRGVPAEATAETAVIARDRALNAGQRTAYDRMAAALGLPRGIPDAQIEGLVQSLVIESERITTRGYSARLTVNFNPGRVAAMGGRSPGAPPGAIGAPGTLFSAPGGPATGPAPAGTPTAQAPGIGGPAVATVEALALYRSFPEWVEITRRLGAASPVARFDIVSLTGESARLRLGLRTQPPEAAAELAQSGIALAPAPIDSRPGEGWRLSLAGGR